MKLETLEQAERILRIQQILLVGMLLKVIIKDLIGWMLDRYILHIMRVMVALRKKLIEKSHG
jgi:hypothetical protein